MPGVAQGLGRALRRAVREGASEAKVRRPGEEALDAPPKEPVPPGTVPEQAAVETPEAPQLEATPSSPAVATPTPEPAPVATPPASLNPETSAPQPRVELPETPLVESATVTEATRLSQLQLGDFALDESFQTNFDTITTTDEIKSVIADVAVQNSARIDEARRGVITNEQLTQLAAELDINEDVVRAVMERESGGILNAETILAARQVLNSSAERIHTLAQKISQGQATDLDRLTFRRQIQWHAEFQTQFMGARAEAGRALNAFRIPTGADIDIAHVREMVETAAGHDTDQVAKAIALMDNPTAITKATRQYTQSKLMGSINELFINSILSGPKTHVINTAGNLLFQAMNIAETAVAARIGRFLSGEEHVMVGEASALLHGTISAWRDGLRLAAKTAKTGIPLDDVVKFEGTKRRSISAENLLTPEQRATPIGAFVEALLDGVRVPVGGDRSIPVPGVGPIIRAPTERVMAPTDELFKTLAYRAELERQAYLHAFEQVSSGAATMDQAAQIVRDFMENAPASAVKAAEDYTRYVTFQNPLGPTGQRFQLALRSAPIMSLLAPFIRTPVNLFKAGIMDRSPVALFRPKFYAAMRAGGRERDMMLARVTMGSATSAVVASYVMDGTITGAGPSNSDARELLQMTGWQPYSIKIGDTYHSYARMEPLAFTIGATADAVEVLSYINSDVDGLEDERQQVNDAIAAIIIGIANNTMSKTYVKGISDFTEMMSDPARYFEAWSRNITSAMVPYSQFRAQIGAIEDPYLREAWTVLDQLKVKSGIPGYSENAPPRRDLFGQPRRAPSGSLLGPMSPLPERTEVVDPVLDELVTLMEQTRAVPVTSPGKRIEGMRLNAEEYDKLYVISRTRPGPNGRTFKEELQRVMSLPAYAKATPDMRVELIKDVQARYDEIARLLLEQEDPLFAARIAAHRRKRDQLRFGQ